MEEVERYGDTRLGKSGVVDEGEVEDKDHKVPIQLGVEFPSEGADNGDGGG